MQYRIVVYNTMTGQQFIPQYRQSGWRWLLGWCAWEHGLTEMSKSFDTLEAAEKFVELAKRAFEPAIVARVYQ